MCGLRNPARPLIPPLQHFQCSPHIIASYRSETPPFCLLFNLLSQRWNTWASSLSAPAVVGLTYVLPIPAHAAFTQPIDQGDSTAGAGVPRAYYTLMNLEHPGPSPAPLPPSPQTRKAARRRPLDTACIYSICYMPIDQYIRRRLIPGHGTGVSLPPREAPEPPRLPGASLTSVYRHQKFA